MSRVVLDTNVLISALIARTGKPARILAYGERLALLTSEDILIELERVLHYPRIQRKYRLTDTLIGGYLEHIRMASTVVEVHTSVHVVTMVTLVLRYSSVPSLIRTNQALSSTT